MFKLGYFDEDDVQDYQGCVGDYYYKISCVSANGDDINDMVDEATDVSYGLLKKHCTGLRGWELSAGYRPDGSKGLTLRNDWAVSFHKSTYRGKPCYYIDHSSIEYVWVKE
jgi:hypothetical protein